ncbi:MAG: DeoR/GlpR family DNA-binding transcription regulator [Chloroflexota bacterium]|nr:DeoR/GlpR family DNA-binding transcription regulator [Chloroflexota bacterium]
MQPTWKRPNQAIRRGRRESAVRPALARQRQAYILERVREEGAVRVADLVDTLGVSDMTVRRDLGVLHDRGLIEKMHGGAAALPGSPVFEPGFRAKSTLMQAEKEAIAAAAARLVTPGSAIALSGGTTTYALALRLVDIPDLTVVTNSIAVAEILHVRGRDDQTLILSGGVRTPSDALVGPLAVASISSLHVDTVFMGVHGMYQRGFTTPNILEAETNRALIEAGRRLVVLADHSKWGVIGISAIARLDEAETLISDSGLDLAVRASLDGIVNLIVVDPVARAERREWVAAGARSS